MRHSGVRLLVPLLCASLFLGGCLEPLGLGDLSRPDHRVSRTPLQTTGWNTDGTFTVQVDEVEPVEVRIEAEATDGRTVTESGFSDSTTPVTVQLPDGTWTVTYFVDGYEWETFEGARIDTEAPRITGLETLVRAPDGTALIGDGATVEDDADLRVSRPDGSLVGTRIPVRVTGLADGVHVFSLVATDAAGNEASETVQVLSGSAEELPEPRYTAGIVARYTAALRLWDLTALDEFLAPAEARSRVPAHYSSGSGTGITPDDPAVQAVVDEVVQPGMTTGEAALELYRWMYDQLEYNRQRLQEDDLLEPAQTIADGGGVCRDLAALYASLLRAAGIPARLVAGYLAGTVNGFHAWVEFYGGAGPQGQDDGSPWVPVDVSGIGSSDDPDDDGYNVAGMLQAFGIARPDYLAMRVLTPQEEQTDWSTAAILQYQGGPPDAPFQKDATILFETKQDLCVHTVTLVRDARRTCTAEHNARIDDFPVLASRTLDYGIEVRDLEEGTVLTLSIVYPDRASVAPDEVEYLAYFEPDNPQGGSGLRSSGFTEDAETGRAEAEIRA